MKQITDEAYYFLAHACENAVKEFLDDPDGMVGGDGPEQVREMYEHYSMLCHVAQDCGGDFWMIALEVGTPYEINRLRTYLDRAKAADPLKGEVTQ